MSMFDKLKRWVGLAPKSAPVDTTKTVTLPNGRVAVLDELGNFVKFI